jgi:hypothetical protein
MTVARNAAGKANPRVIPRVYHKILRRGKFLKFFFHPAVALYTRGPPEEFICPVNRQILVGIVVLALIVPNRPPRGFDAIQSGL